MKLDISISVLLTSLLYAISVSAVPARRNANPGMVTLPLKRLHQTRTDIHPHLFIQQHKNRGHRRLARMTGRSEPSADELRRNLMKRVSMLESELVARSKTSESEALVGSNFSGRFRTGKAAKGIAAGAAGAAGAGALGAGEIAHGQAGADMPVGSNGTMAGGMMEGNGTMAGNGTATGTGSMTGNGTTTGTGSTTGNGTTTGTGSTTGKGDTGKGATGKGATGKGTTTGTGSTTGNGTTTGTGSATGNGTTTGTGSTTGKGTVGGGVATGTGSTTGNGTTTGTGSTTGNGTTTGTGSTTGNGTTTGTGSTSGNGTTTGNSTGVSQIDIQAAQNGGLTAANTPTANNSLGLDIEADDVGYIATVQIGTPAQDFKILMDSGSADFWVGSENCQAQAAGGAGGAGGAGAGCGNHTFLGSQSSTSFKQSTQQFQVEYGSGAVAGVLCQDNVNIAGLALNAHTFGVANQESVQFASDTVPFDGLMGLAQSTLSEEGVPTPVESLASAGLISSAITSFKISRLSDQLNDGEVTFGGLDATKFVANSLVTFPNVNTQGFWEGAMTALTVNGADSGLTNRTAILDTGTTLVMAPPQDAATINQMLGGACDSQGTCTVPCTMNSSLALTFGGAAFAIDPSDITVLPMDLNDPTGTCMSGIQAGSVGGADEWLVGDVFLKNAYFSTDIGKNQISLAQLAQS